MKIGFRFVALSVSLAALALGISGPGSAMSMKEAVSRAVRSNPEIGQAIANRAAIQFELEQGHGLYRPRVDLEGGIGGEIRDNYTTRSNGNDDRLFLRRQASVVVRQTLFDGFGTRAEIERQASRVDGASLRVRERAEFIALAVIREYLELQRTSREIALAKDNIAYHQKILGEITQGTGGGALSVSDRQQAQERVFAARARLVEFVEEHKASEAAFIRLVGSPPSNISGGIDIKGKLPKNLNRAIDRARSHHPSIKFAQADIDAAAALVKAAKSKYSPTVTLEGNATAGKDLGGEPGFDGDLQANVVVRWNLYNGGIDSANEQEQIRRVDEAYMSLHKIDREVEEGVRLSWDRRIEQSQRMVELLRDLSAADQLRVSYLEQFRIGERSLLDLLDTQNTRFSIQLAVATSDAAVKFASYRLLAATGDLLQTIGVAPPEEARTYAREAEKVPETPSPDSFNRVDPPAPGQ